MKNLSYQSANGSTTIHACLWDDVFTPPKGLVQIVHGMSEHIERYDELARFLNERGFVVFGNDHLAHGMSVDATYPLGCLPLNGGKEVLIEDVHALRKQMTASQGPLPYFILGHSMGSFVTRTYLARHGEGVRAAIICGTATMGQVISKAGNLLARILGTLRGHDHVSELLHAMGSGSYEKQVKGAKNPMDWLSLNEKNVEAYCSDPLCGFKFSAGGYATLTSLVAEMGTPAHASHLPKDLPLFFIAGAEDPVGDCGKGVTKAAELYKAAGMTDVSLKLYQGMRHEIFNEDGRQEVMDDVAAWIEEKLA